MNQLNLTEWERLQSQNPQAHLLQTGAWGELKSQFGWRPIRVQQAVCSAQVLFRKLPFGVTVAYLPKCPINTDWSTFLPQLERVCQAQRAVFLTIEPDLSEPLDPSTHQLLTEFGAPVASIQPRRTLIVDLRGSENDWLVRMSKKTRHALDYAVQNGISAVYSDDIETFIHLLRQTGDRALFGVHTPAYYRRALQLFAPGQKTALILAQRAGHILAGLMVFRHGNRAYYLYGASSGEDRQFNPTYLIQLESMRWAAQQGCNQYDLWGVPDADLAVLEEQFTTRKDGLWGVYGYKRKFGGQLVRSVGAWRKVYQPALFAVYQTWQKLRGGESG